jgi:hypothetical protein
MSEPPSFVEVEDFPGDDYVSRWKVYVEHIYQRYLRTVASGKLSFRGLEVKCQFRPMTHGKAYGFWHMMQEGSGGRAEEDRTIDLERCRRIEWIAWVIRNAESHPEIRVFKQTKRWGEQPWALWLHEYDYLLILWERKDYFLLKTAFYPLRRGKLEELERDWTAAQKAGNG